MDHNNQNNDNSNPMRVSVQGRVHSFESFGSVDGPGVRFVLFLTGCQMRCAFCHNPDTWDLQKGTQYLPEEIIKKALRYQNYWGKTGGLTVSGGEPLLQIDFLIELAREAKNHGIHFVVDTSGNPFQKEGEFFEKFQELLTLTDLFLLDIKHINRGKHRRLTGQDNQNILEMANYLSAKGKAMWIRHVLVPGWTDQREDLLELRHFIDSLNTVEKVEILAYHTMGVYKWLEMGLEYPLSGVEPPTLEQLEFAKGLLEG